MRSRTMMVGILGAAALLFGCPSDDDGATPDSGLPDAGDTGPEVPGPGVDLEADAPFDVTHDGAMLRLQFLVEDVNRRVNELLFLDGPDGILGAVREALGDEPGTTDCGSGSVTVTAESLTVDNPFGDAGDSFASLRYVFDDCEVSSLASGALITNLVLDGTIVVGEGSDDVTRFVLEGPATLTRQVATPFAGTYTWWMSGEVFVVPTFGTSGTDRVIGRWQSGSSVAMDPVAAGARFDLEGPGGAGMFVLDRSTVSGESGRFIGMEGRVRLDSRSNDADDCAAPGEYHVVGTLEPLAEDGPAAEFEEMAYTITGADGVSARITLQYELLQNGMILPDGFLVTIDGVEEHITSSQVGQLRSLVQSTCRQQFSGF